MTDDHSPPPVLGWLPLVAAVLFAVAHTQPPLYYSNQNQYFLHGLAAASYGDLAGDWLANTRDPTPVFSAGVALAYRTLGEWPFHAVFFGLLVVYFLSLWGVISALPIAPRSAAGHGLFAALLIVAHAGIVRAASVALVGVDYPWYFQAGVANQYLLGAGLQPSVFGVTLLSAMAAYLRGRPVLAGGLAAAACVLHSTYLLPAGLLVAGMMTGQWRDGNRWTAVVTGAVALVVVAPVIVFTWIVFGPSSAEMFTEAQRILAWVRIPHHTDVASWLDGVAGLQLGWAAIGMALVRQSRLFPVLGVAAGVALALSIVQIVTGNATLALLFPWRISAVLVPMATAILAGRVACSAESFFSLNVVWGAAGLLVVTSEIGAVVVYNRSLGYQSSRAEEGLIAFVREHRQPGDLYLLPTGFPPPPRKGKGSASSSFIPATGSEVKIFELQRFRLATGAAAYIDFKSIPYRDGDVIEWQNRVAAVEQWYATPDWDAAGVVAVLQAKGITHVVVPASSPVTSARLVEVFADASYRVYRITGAMP